MTLPLSNRRTCRRVRLDRPLAGPGEVKARTFGRLSAPMLLLKYFSMPRIGVRTPCSNDSDTR